MQTPRIYPESTAKQTKLLQALTRGFSSVFVLLVVILSPAGVSSVRAADSASRPSGSGDGAAGLDEGIRKKVEQKAGRMVDALKLDDPAKAAKVKAIAGEWIATMLSWHQAHDAELARLWGEWNRARAVVPKDEFPGELVAHQIDDVYSSLKPAYEDFLKRLAAELTPEQIDAIKENWSRSPGMTRTYNAYLEIVPELAEKDKQVIHDRLLMAREAAMLTDSDREIVAIYKRHKVKVEQYVGTLEWAKLHKAFAERGKSASAATKPGDEPPKK